MKNRGKWTKGIVLAAALMLAATPVGAQSTYANVPNDEHQALARQLVDVTMPLERQDQLVPLTVAILALFYSVVAIQSPDLPDLDQVQWAESLMTAVSASKPEMQATLVDAYAGAMSTEELQSALRFFQSPEGVEATRARITFGEEVLQLLAERSIGGGDYVPSAAETAFNDTPAGRAFTAVVPSNAASFAMMRAQIEAAQHDYCEHEVCADGQAEVFRRIGVLLDEAEQAGAAE